MKNLNNFIFEKLKVNSKTKINNKSTNYKNINSGNEIVDKIQYYFNIDPNENYIDSDIKIIRKELIECIEEWVKKYKVENIKFVCDEYTLKILSARTNNFAPYNEYKHDLEDEYDINDDINKKCEYLIKTSESEQLYSHLSYGIRLWDFDGKMLYYNSRPMMTYCLNTDKI